MYYITIIIMSLYKCDNHSRLSTVVLKTPLQRQDFSSLEKNSFTSIYIEQLIEYNWLGKVKSNVKSYML